MVQQEASVRWALILTLAAFGLVRPLLSILGAYGSIERPWGPVLVTILISAIWVGVVAAGRVPSPVLTLAAVGAVYGVLAIVLQQIMWTILLDGPPEGAPSSAPILMISWIAIVVTNTIWGTLLGLLAAGVRSLLARRPLRQHSG